MRFLTKTYFAMNIEAIIADSPDSVLMQRSLRVLFCKADIKECSEINQCDKLSHPWFYGANQGCLIQIAVIVVKKPFVIMQNQY